MSALPSEKQLIQQARHLLKDLFRPNPVIYWADFLVHLTVGYAAASVYLSGRAFTWQWVACYVIAGFALFRVGSFIHEIVHMTGKHLLGFRIAWNILAGIPMLTPSFFYRNHIDHHSQKHYGTGLDGEYLPLGSGMLREVAYFYCQVVLLPLFVFARFAIITPLSFLHPRLRVWALERVSFFVINLRYWQPIPTQAPRKLWAAVEIACCIRAWLIPLFVGMGWAPWERIPLLYSLAIMTLGLNYIRNLVAHRYAGNGEAMSHMEQLADSVTIDGPPVVTELFFPLYLRYHALHHWFPSLPYHNLKRAHQRLMAEFPAGSVYHQTIYPGFWARVRELVADARLARQRKLQGDRIGADEWYENRGEMLRDKPIAGKAAAA